MVSRVSWRVSFADAAFLLIGPIYVWFFNPLAVFMGPANISESDEPGSSVESSESEESEG